MTSDCEVNCLTCRVGDPRYCLSCTRGLHRIKNPPLCECELGYY